MDKQAFQRDLLTWYSKNKKPLPWRETKNPYKIWISEIMSQQTQVETVIPYYERFIRKYPDLTSLSKADDAELLKLWEGLGYYSRARNLKLAAQEICEQFDGQFPQNVTDLLSLKGIGPYTAAAIASISFKQPEPAVDGNLMRVTSRLFRMNADISKANSRKIFSEKLRTLISKKEPGDFNQALMDLGSLICTPKVPKCVICPLQSYCQAYQQDSPEKFPVKSKKPKVKELYYAAFAIENPQETYYLERRSDVGLLAGMWLFPMVALSKKEFEQILSDGFVKKQPELPEKIVKTIFIGQITHLFSHQKWHMALIKAIPEVTLEQSKDRLTEEKQWMTDLSKVPLAGPQIKLFDLLKKQK